jgi:hypothetical protein
LNFKYDQNSDKDYQPITVLQLILEGEKPGEIKTAYLKSKDVNNRIRIAKEWEPGLNGLAESYLLHDKGLM